MAEEIVKKFGVIVRRLRSERGYSQEAFAHRSGLHRTYQGIIERGQKAVTLATAKKIAAALDLSLWELLREVEEDPEGE